MKYRPEIDGLRAVAVAAVIAYHAELGGPGARTFRGGFLGVDVFFVISGYLITAILLRALSEGGPVFRSFYERRARRILPALFLVTLVSVPFAWGRMFHSAFEEFASSALAATLFYSNFFFLGQGGYAAEANQLKPLLHTWSLSVEEQFYALYPLALFVVFRFARRRILPILLGAGVASLLLAEVVSLRAPAAAFYLLPTRGWELLAGAVLAQLERATGRRGFSGRGSSRWNGGGAAVGFVLVLASIATFDDRMRHPGLIGAIPIAGTVLLIWCSGGGDGVSRILRSAPLVALGRISYSLYLWHQPVFVFARLDSVDRLGWQQKLACVAICLGLSILSWRLVETPFRKAGTVTRKALVAALGGGAALLVAFGVAGASLGDPSLTRLPKAAVELVDRAVDRGRDLGRDGRDCTEFEPGRAPCVFEADRPGPTWVTLGDSHLKPLHSPLLDAIDERGGRLVPMTRNGCLYLLGIDRWVAGSPHPCTDGFNRRRRQALLELDRPIVILGGRWQWYLEETPFDNGEGGVERDSDWPRLVAEGEAWDSPAPLDTVARALRETVADLVDGGVRVVLLYPIPEAGWNVPTSLALLLSKHAEASDRRLEEFELTTSYEVFRKRAAGAYRMLDSVPDHPLLVRVRPEELLCNTAVPGRCITHDGGEVLYRDDDHLSLAGSRRLVAALLGASDERWGLDPG